MLKPNSKDSIGYPASGMADVITFDKSLYFLSLKLLSNLGSKKTP